MPRYNILATMTLDFSASIDVPTDIVKEGPQAIKEYAEQHFLEIAENGGLENVGKQSYSYSENSLEFNAEDCTRVKCADDDLENDLMEFDIF